MRALARIAALCSLAAAVGSGPAAAQDAQPPAPAFQPPAILAQRRRGLKELGVNAAAAAGLDWLRRHQSPDGHWDSDRFKAQCAGLWCSGEGEASCDVGITGLATLAFLGAGSTQTDGPDAANVRKALQYLADIQDSEGCFGPRRSMHFMYGQCAATMATAEALWLTGDEKLREPVRKARDFIVAARNENSGWRYNVPRDGDTDTSVTVWCSTALRTCEFAGLDVPYSEYAGAHRAFDLRTALPSVDSGLTGYQQRPPGAGDARAWLGPSRKPGDPAPDWPEDRVMTSDFEKSFPPDLRNTFPRSLWSSCSAGAGFVSAITGGADRAEAVERASERLVDQPPSLSAEGGFLDLHYLLLGSLLNVQLSLVGPGPKNPIANHWRPWRQAAVADLLSTQSPKKAGCAAGSWDPKLDPFGEVGGRVYATAMAVLALQAPNRYPKVWDPKAKRPAPPKNDGK